MTREELITLGKQKVRSNSNLMQTYIELFQEHLGRKPQCAGCTFNSDWEKFVSLSAIKTAQSLKNTEMKKQKSTKHILKKAYREEILSYKMPQSNKTYKLYGKDITDAFAEAYLTNGTSEEIEERIQRFEKSPKKTQPKKNKEITEELNEEAGE